MKELALRGRAFPSDLNPAGKVFGGWIMAKMDKAASIAVEDVVHATAVTVAVTDLHFLQPILSGDIVSIYTQIIAIGNTSIKINVEVEVKCKKTRKEYKVTDAVFTFVTIDEESGPINVREVIRKEVSPDILKLLEKKPAS